MPIDIMYITVYNYVHNKDSEPQEREENMKYIIWHDNGKSGQKGYSEFNSEKEKDDFAEHAENHNILIYEIEEIK